MRRFLLALAAIAGVICSVPSARAQAIPALPQLTVQGQNFVNPNGQPVRLWGLNLVEFYPDHATATAFAQNLAARGVNVVRWHRMLEWNYNFNYLNAQGGSSIIACLASYNYDANAVPQGTSRPAPTTADATAWDRFDFLNAELQRNGVYVLMAVEFGRTFTQADQSILSVNPTDDAAWRAAVLGMTNWGDYLYNLDTGAYTPGANMGNYLNTIDKWKMLPIIDERAALLYDEFVATLLNHVNPYTGVAYKNSTQIAAMEIINEYSTLYVTINGNRFDNAPATVGSVSYFDTELQSRWRAYLAANNQPYVNLYNLTTPALQQLSYSFFLSLDNAIMQRMQSTFASVGATINLSFSNTWRSESDAQLDHDISSHSQNHIYFDPFVVEGWTSDGNRHTVVSDGGVTRNVYHDFVYDLSIQKAFTDRPLLVGEFNMFDYYTPGGQSEIDEMRRTMMMVAAAAYGSLHNWSGFTWFAATHGALAGIGANGWSSYEAQELPVNSPSDLANNYSTYIGGMMEDGQRLDHMRTLGLMFRNGYVWNSSNPITLVVDQPYPVSTTFPPLTKYYPFEGWQNISAIRKTYGTKPAGQDTAPFMTTLPSNPLVSDTGQITKDVVRQQLTVSAPAVEAFSGNFDANAPANLKAFNFPTSNVGNFGTVVAVSNDGNPLSSSVDLLISRTNIDIASRTDVAGPDIKLPTVPKAPAGLQWQVKYTRPRANYPSPAFTPAPLDASGNPTFSSPSWTEAELALVSTAGGTQPAPVAPTGTITSAAPTYVWRPMQGAVGYSIWVNNNATTGVVSSYQNVLQANCNATQCSSNFGSQTPLQIGTATFWIAGFTGPNQSVVSAPLSFTIAGASPVPLAPSGTISNRTPTYAWQPMANATGYSIWLNNNANNGYVNSYVTAAQACTPAQCSSNFGGAPLAPGSATFWIEGYVDSPSGVISAPLSFTVQ